MNQKDNTDTLLFEKLVREKSDKPQKFVILAESTFHQTSNYILTFYAN